MYRVDICFLGWGNPLYFPISQNFQTLLLTIRLDDEQISNGLIFLPQ